MAELMNRSQLIPEAELPDLAEMVAEGRKLAAQVPPGRSAFLDHYGVSSEAEYKRRCVEEGRIMLHAHIGFRDPDKTRRSCAEIYETLDKRGYRVDRFGFCFDHNMGYPPDIRGCMSKGTGLILESPEDWIRLTASAPVAPHFGDFMIGMPAALENAAMAVACGATTMGNIGHYYSYRMQHMDDDVAMGAQAVKALAFVAAQPVEIQVTSNNDDGFGPLFTDVSCCIGLIMVEQHIVETLLGARHITVFGNMVANPFNRMAFARALSKITCNPGAMVYGSTTKYDMDRTSNWATLASYLTFDIAAQRLAPTGHAVTPVPVTEYERIPDTDEIIEVQLFANRLVEQGKSILPLVDERAIEETADRLVEGGLKFRNAFMRRLDEIGIDTNNPLELLLCIRRAGARNLEAWFGPGAEDATAIRGRRPVVTAENLVELQDMSKACLAALPADEGSAIASHGFTACVATTDVHEYGKILVESVFSELGVALVDGGVAADPDDLARTAKESGADFIALSTYNGIALSYLGALRDEMRKIDLDIPVFVGGRLNQIPEGSNTSLPVDVSGKLGESGAYACSDVREMLSRLVSMPSRGERAA